MTLGARMRRSHGHPAGFDVLRLGLAAAVIVQHGVNVTEGQGAANALFQSPWRALFEPVLPTFFALSGFLVAGSFERCRSLVGFGGLRVLRLAPALAVEVAISALVLGPLFTSLPWSAYLQDATFRAYFLNALGLIHYRLPAVFAGNPEPFVVNAQLWTIPYELECYVALAVLAVLGIARRPRLLAMTLVLGQGMLAASALLSPLPQLEVTPTGRSLVLCFLAGLFMHQLRDRVPYRRPLVLAAVLAVQLLIWLPGGSWLLALPVTYCTVVVGTMQLPKPRILFDGDYSYGMYLYGFPIQQSLVRLWPGMPWAMNAGLALGLAFALARLSWWGVERHALRWRPALHAFETRVLDRLPARVRLAGPTPAAPLG